MKSISKLTIILLFLFISNYSFAQEEVILQTQKDTIQQMPNDSGEVFVFVEDQPNYPGGDEARIKYLQKNIHYPKEAKEAGIQGTVYVTFIIEKDGRITNVKVLRGVGGGLDKESVRVIKSMPIWEPGRQRGKAIRCQFNMPIRFILADDSVTKPLTKKEKKALKKKQKAEAKAKQKSDQDIQKAGVGESPTKN